jgi:hypothetical protein
MVVEARDWGSGAGSAGVGRRTGWAAWVEEAKHAGWDGWAESEENFFFEKNWIFEYTKALEIYTRRFRGNFDVGIFPKFF